MVNPAPVRVARKSTMNSPLVKAANKIVTSPTFAKARSIDFDKKNEYDKFIKFIESSNQELLRIKLPRKDEVIKAGGLGDGGKGGGGFLGGLLSGLLGPAILGLAQRLMRRFKPLRNLRRFLIPRRFRARLRKIRMDILRPFRNFKKFIKSIPGKIRAKLTKYADDAVKILKKYTDDAVLAIKNLKNAKWIKNLIRQSKKVTTLVDDGVKLGKEFLTNSKVLKSSKTIVQKAAPKITSMGIGELTIIGGIAADVTTGAYRLEKGDNTGAALSFIGAIPIVGIPFNLIDIGRDVGLFEEGGALDWLDFLDWFRLNKDNPNYVDKRTAEEKEIDEDIDAYLKEEYEKDLLNQLENLPEKNSGNRKAINAKSRTLQNALRELRDGTLTSDKLRSKVGKEFTDGDIKFFGKNKSSYDEIEKFLENVESKDVIVPDNSASTTIINNSQSFLLPFKNDGESIFTGGDTPNFNITTNVIDFDYSKMNSSFTDELLFLKLDK